MNLPDFGITHLGQFRLFQQGVQGNIDPSPVLVGIAGEPFHLAHGEVLGLDPGGKLLKPAVDGIGAAFHGGEKGLDAAGRCQQFMPGMLFSLGHLLQSVLLLYQKGFSSLYPLFSNQASIPFPAPARKVLPKGSASQKQKIRISKLRIIIIIIIVVFN